jgi:hypothetical protein
MKEGDTKETKRKKKESKKKKEVEQERDTGREDNVVLFEGRRRANEEALRTMLNSKHIGCICTLASHDDTVESLATNNENIFSASWDNSIKVFSSHSLLKRHLKSLFLFSH